MHKLYINLYEHIYNDRLGMNDDIICHYLWHWNENTDFRHQYFNGSVNCLQDMCCIIESELLAVWSMSWMILIDGRNPFSRQRDERYCRHVFRLYWCPREKASNFQIWLNNCNVWTYLFLKTHSAHKLTFVPIPTKWSAAPLLHMIHLTNRSNRLGGKSFWEKRYKIKRHCQYAHKQTYTFK